MGCVRRKGENSVPDTLLDPLPSPTSSDFELEIRVGEKVVIQNGRRMLLNVTRRSVWETC